MSDRFYHPTKDTIAEVRIRIDCPGRVLQRLTDHILHHCFLFGWFRCMHLICYHIGEKRRIWHSSAYGRVAPARCTPAGCVHQQVAHRDVINPAIYLRTRVVWKHIPRRDIARYQYDVQSVLFALVCVFDCGRRLHLKFSLGGGVH